MKTHLLIETYPYHVTCCGILEDKPMSMTRRASEVSCWNCHRTVNFKRAYEKQRAKDIAQMFQRINKVRRSLES